MRELESLDPALAASIGAGHFVFWYDPKRMDYFDRVFSIGDPYCVWGPIGIVAFLVYAYYKAALVAGRIFPLTNHSAAKLANREVRKKTRSWLAEKSFPSRLVECFDE